VRAGIAVVGWTVQLKSSVAQPPNFHLTAAEFSFAQNAKALVIE
jgi:hypothetical protein